MGLRFFTIPVRSADEAQAELNAFLHSKKVLAVERRWVDLGENSFWSVVVDYLEGGSPSSSRGRGDGRGKIDYREVLNEADFAVFAKLRDLRKQMAESEAVPVYTVFTNEQLAEMVKTRAASKSALEKIAGVGDARIEKYGAKVLDFLKTQWNGTHAPDGKAF